MDEQTIEQRVARLESASDRQIEVLERLAAAIGASSGRRVEAGQLFGGGIDSSIDVAVPMGSGRWAALSVDELNTVRDALFEVGYNLTDPREPHLVGEILEELERRRAPPA